MINLFPLSLLFFFFSFSFPWPPASSTLALWVLPSMLHSPGPVPTFAGNGAPQPMAAQYLERKAHPPHQPLLGTRKWQQTRDLHREMELNVLVGVTVTLTSPHWDLCGSSWCWSPQSL